MYASWGGQSDEFLSKKAKEFFDKGFRFDVAHFDAGWYGKCPVTTSYVWSDGTQYSGLWARQVGDWEFNQFIHPTHLKETIEEYEKLAPRVSFWYEFERAYKDCDTVKALDERKRCESRLLCRNKRAYGKPSCPLLQKISSKGTDSPL